MTQVTFKLDLSKSNQEIDKQIDKIFEEIYRKNLERKLSNNGKTN